MPGRQDDLRVNQSPGADNFFCGVKGNDAFVGGLRDRLASENFQGGLIKVNAKVEI